MSSKDIQTKMQDFLNGGVPFDARFPNQSQTKNCYQNFLDYQKCVKAKGEDFAPCSFFARNFKTLCPNAWVSMFIEFLTMLLTDLMFKQ